MIQRICFQCQFCGKILLTKQAMKNHEERCFRNPARKACVMCAYPYYLFGSASDPFSGESKRVCNKGHDINKSLRADCNDFLLNDPDDLNFYTTFYPEVMEKMENCKHENIGYTDGKPDAQEICEDCKKIF